MQRNKGAWAAAAIIMPVVGGPIGHLHLIAPKPVAFFTLGIIATLSVLGIAYGFWKARRIVQSGKPIGN
jgi:hypothetical protein